MTGSKKVDLWHNKTGIFGKMLNKRECIEYGSNRGPDVPKSERVKTVIYEIHLKNIRCCADSNHRPSVYESTC